MDREPQRTNPFAPPPGTNSRLVTVTLSTHETIDFHLKQVDMLHGAFSTHDALCEDQALRTRFLCLVETTGSQHR